MAGEFPTSFRDPLYAQLDTATEKKLGLPAGLLSSIRLNGEKSNNDQVSEAGARSPYQFIPSTRRAVLEKYGIDPLLSPQNASEAAGLLLKEGLQRNAGDPVLAAGEYHAGPDRKGWGPRTQAYMQRVSQGLTQAKSDALSEGFAAFMKANPAIPAQGMPQPASAMPAQPTAGDTLGRDFGAWMAARTPQGDLKRVAIPTEADPQGLRPVDQQPAPDPTLGQQIVGAGEALLSGATGAVGGTLGALQALPVAIAREATNPNPPAGDPMKRVEQAVMAGAERFTYQPRTPTGQDMAQGLGNLLTQTIPIIPLGGELAMAAQAGRAAQPTVAAVPAIARNTAAVAAEQLGSAAQNAGQAVASAPARIVQAVTGRAPAAAEAARPTPGTMGSVGAAGTDMALQRAAAAQQLPEPIQLTRGQATRDFAQQRFERETAKNPELGMPLRERMAEQNQQVLRNMDIYFDQTGAQAPDLRTAGIAVDRALVEQAKRDKTQVRVAYKNAEKAGEMEAPVTLQNVVQHLNDTAPEAATAPLLTTARAKAIQTGIATVDDAGNLVAQPVPLRIAETFRQAVGNATDYTPTNVRQAAILKQLVDTATDGLGGNAYREARALRARYAANYENRANIATLLDNKRGTADRAVAFEDVFNHSILKGSLDDVRNMRRVLQRGGEEGQQAWRELQGQTVNYIRDQAAKNVARDERGNVVVSPAGLDRAIKSLDADGKLDFIFGKRGAEQMRTLNDVAKHIYTSPPGAVNTSNTASVLLAALDMAISGAGGMPLPITSGLRLVANNIKDRRLRIRVADALRGAEPEPAPKKPAARPRSAVTPKKPTVH